MQKNFGNISHSCELSLFEFTSPILHFRHGMQHRMVWYATSNKHHHVAVQQNLHQHFLKLLYTLYLILFCVLQEVTALEFHPFASVLVSGGKDCTIKLFDISKPSVKKAYRAIQVCTSNAAAAC